MRWLEALTTVGQFLALAGFLMVGWLTADLMLRLL